MVLHKEVHLEGSTSYCVKNSMKDKQSLLESRGWRALVKQYTVEREPTGRVLNKTAIRSLTRVFKRIDH